VLFILIERLELFLGQGLDVLEVAEKAPDVDLSDLVVFPSSITMNTT
jgi:hypothetical protein